MFGFKAKWVNFYFLCNEEERFVHPHPSSHVPRYRTRCGDASIALPALEEVPRVLTTDLQTYNTKVMKTDNAIYFALMSLRQW